MKTKKEMHNKKTGRNIRNKSIKGKIITYQEFREAERRKEKEEEGGGIIGSTIFP